MASHEGSADISPPDFAPAALARDWFDYLVDSAQRAILTAEVLRQRGNQYVEHVVLGRPPVLVFDHDLVTDGRTLPNPVNYQLLQIRPDPDHSTDPLKRPIVIVDPRAGHGPGIGGFKTDSQVGLALANGYPCYFVSFLPEPVPGQTVEDIAKAEAKFLETVTSRHPEAEDRPVIIGNCQAGWAVAILSSVAPELMSVVILNGAPMSYWSGEIGRNPMRYLGGLLGGSWLAALSGDLGHGRFDGANLVSNFEFLDPANTLWKKPYNLYANVDTEGPRFLEFERWWSGYFLMNKEEMSTIVDDLFIGNRLAAGDIVGSGGNQVNLRAIKAPIVVFCSKGDNITPPQQALDWILDVYDDVDDIRANGQVIVYLLHESIGHLGIFVSAKVAKREHRAIVDNLDVISVLPPGLYEMKIDAREIHFDKRDFDDIRALGGHRREEVYFRLVKQVSQINSQIYDSVISPWVRAFSTETGAEIQRRANPNRVRRYAWSDVNPAMAAIPETASLVRQWRHPTDADNVFRRAEKRNGDLTAAWLDHYRDWRDRMLEGLFFASYLPLHALMLPEEQAALEAEAEQRARIHRDARAWLQGQAERHMDDGGVAEAVLRIVLHLTRRRRVFDSRRFRLAEAALRHTRLFANVSGRTFRGMVREQAQRLMIDEGAAIAALGRMVQSAPDREEVVRVVESIATEVGGFDSEQQHDFDRISRQLSPQVRAPQQEEKPPAISEPATRSRKAKSGETRPLRE